MELEQAAFAYNEGQPGWDGSGNTPQDLKFGGVFFYYEKNNTIRKLLNGLSG